MQRVELEVDQETKSVFTPLGLKLPCELKEGGCETTSLDPFAYSWDVPENCIVTKLFTQVAKMIKFTNEPDPPQYYIISTHDMQNDVYRLQNNMKIDHTRDIKLRINNERTYICGKPTPLFITNFDDLFVSFTGGFDMNTGKTVISKNSVNYYKMQVGTDNKIRVNGFYETPKNELVGSQYFGNNKKILENVGKDTIDYDAHMRMKINFMMYKVYRDLEQTDFLILQNMCELRRTQIQMINALSYENNRLAGYMLTGNRSMFLEIEGVIGFLYPCPKKISPLKVLDRCYDRIPIFYDGKTMFVNPITRQTFPFANEIDCTDTFKNLFQLDLDNNNSWYQLMPAPVPFKPPAVFAPQQIGYIQKIPDYDSRRAGIYTVNQLKDFWRTILHKSASNSVFKKISRTVLQNAHVDSSQRDIYRAAGLNNRLYLDSMLSPSFFLDHFKSTFGEIGYYIERAGILFACFMLIKFLIDVVIFILRAFEIQKLSKNTIGFWKTLLGASYNLFLLSIVTSIYQTPKNDEKSDNNTNNEPNRSRYLKHTPDNNIYHDNSQIELSPLTAPEVVSPPIQEIPHLYPKVPTEQEVNAIAPP